MKYFILCLLLVCVLTGCANIVLSEYRKLSSGYVGCAPDAIQITDLKRKGWFSAIDTWTVTCKGKVYYCTQTLQEISCKAETVE